MPVLWTFRCYLSAREAESLKGVDEIQAWYDSSGPQIQAKFLTRLRFLAQTPRSGWKREPFDVLHGDCAGLGEIRFFANNVQHRVLGFFSPGNVFTMLLCATEKNNKFEPKNACKIALARKKEVESDDQRSRPCRFPLE
jgi:hypothetical protein